MTAPALPPYVNRATVIERLLQIFPAGFAYRNYCTREIAGSTVFAMLYVGAIDSANRYLGPKHVYRMSDEQAALTSDAERLSYAKDAQQAGFTSRGQSWYADNSREPIRDETLRQGLIAVGAAIDNKNIPTTSGKPRYALAADFAALFDPALTGATLEKAIEKWRAAHLSTQALARIRLVRAGTTRSQAGILIAFPNGETRRLAAGPSSMITKAVVEDFGPRFLDNPVVIWISESGNKVVHRDDLTAKMIGLSIDASRNLPDVILVDLGTDEVAERMLLVFVEVVATDGPISETRRSELLKIATDAGLDAERVAFLTAFLDRDQGPLRKTLATLSWNSFVWLASEPERIIALYGNQTNGLRLHNLLHT